jgi:dienelactone hydrolase
MRFEPKRWKKRVVMTMLSIAMLALAGCGGDKTIGKPTPLPEVPTLNVGSLNRYEQDKVQGPVFEAQVGEFDLGAREYLSPWGQTMPYNLKGVIGVPMGDGPFPVILMTHGSHSNDDESKRFDTGYTYLVEALAKQGFIAISMDLSRPYIWKYGDTDDREKSIYVALDQFEQLRHASAGEAVGYPFDLKNKVDFARIGLMGHSRGGETIMDVAAELEGRAYPVRGMLSVAPTMFFYDRIWSDADVAILVPEYDGDVVGLDGYNLFSVLNNHSIGHHSVTLLKGANHNYFNRNIERNDARMWHSEADLADQLTRSEQEAFLEHFAVDFFQDSLMGRAPRRIYDLRAPQPDKLYGYGVKVLNSAAGAVPLVDLGNLGANVSTEGAEIGVVVDSWFYQHDEVLVDTITGGHEDYTKRPLLHVKWNRLGDKAAFKPTLQDFSQHQALVISLVPDSASELHQGLTHQGFTVRLTDQRGNVSSLNLPEGLNALAMTPGFIDETPLADTTLYFWSRSTPLSAVWVPLASFEAIDLTKIATVELVFDQVEQGEIYVHKMELQ